MKTSLVLATLLALAGTAVADVTLDYAQSVQGTGTPADGDHAVFLSVADDGSVVLLVDGQPVGPPEVPAIPTLP